MLSGTRGAFQVWVSNGRAAPGGKEIARWVKRAARGRELGAASRISRWRPEWGLKERLEFSRCPHGPGEASRVA